MAALNSVRDPVVWLLGFVAFWIIASIPGYGFLSVWLKLREALKETLQAFTGQCRDGRARRKQSAAALRQDLMDRMRAVEIDQTAAAAWDKTLTTILEGVRTGGTQIEKTRTAAFQTTKELEQTAQRVRKLRLVSAVVPDVPTVEEALLRARRNRTAGINLILAAILLVPIMFANAQLTGLVLRELIPPVQPLFGIPLAYVFALIIVIVEAAIGMLHSAYAEQQRETARKVTIEGILWNIAAIGVVGIESLLYSQVQPDSGALRLPIGGSGFALVGAILGLAVFGLGRLAHSSLMTLRKDQAPDVVMKQLNVLKESAEEWNLVADRLQPTQKTCSEQFERLVDLCRQTSQAQEHAIHQFENEVDNLRETPPAWAHPTERPLTQAEFTERESRSYLWITVATVATISLIVLCAQLASHRAATAGAAVGLSLAAAAFAAGALGGQSTPDWSVWRVTWYGVLIVVVGVATFAAVRFLRGSVSVQSAVVLIPAIAAFAAGIQVGPFVAFLGLPLVWLTNRLIDAVLFCCLAMLWSAGVLTAMIEYLTQFIAWPMTAAMAVIRPARAKT